MVDKLWNRNYFLLWQGQVVSSIGGHIFGMAVLLWTKEYTQSATILGFLMMTSAVPAVLLGPLGGALVDHYSRKNIIIANDLINGFNVLVLAGLFYFLPEHKDVILFWLFVTSGISGVLGTLMRPAMLSAVPDIIPKGKIATANAIGMTSMQLIELFTKAIGGVLYRVVGMPLLCLLDGLTFIFSAISELFIDIPEHKHVEKLDQASFKVLAQRFKNDIVSGFLYLISKIGMKEFIIISAIANFFAVPAFMLLPFYVEDYLGATTDWFGYLISAAGVGSLIGFGIAGQLKLSGNARFLCICSIWFALSVATVMLGLFQDRYTAMALFVLIGACNGFAGVTLISVLQSLIAPAMRGRCFGMLTTIGGCLSPIAMGLTGVIFDLTGKNIPAVYITVGAVFAVLGLVVVLNKNCRNLVVCADEKIEPA